MRQDSNCYEESSYPQSSLPTSGFLWMCGSCSNKPTFPTIYELFSHKKTHQLPPKKSSSGEVSPDCSQENTLLLNADKSKQQPVINEGTESFCNSDTDDIPLSKLSLQFKLSSPRKSQRSKKKKKFVAELEDVKSSEEPVCSEEPALPTTNLDINLKEGVIEDVKLLAVPEFNDQSDFEGESLDQFSDNQNDDGDDFDQSESTDKNAKHICKICKTEFVSRRSLSKHKTVHVCPETGMYKCNTCGKQCPKYDNFTRHLTIHEENRTKSFACQLCSSSFYNMADLKRHSILHLEVKPHTCEQCGEGFTRQDALLIHMGKHTGVQYSKFTCKLCGKILNSPSALAMHSKNHTEKSVFCPEPDCDFSCYLQSQLRQHLRKHSGEKPFQCSVCGRCFARSNDMKNHILNVHERFRPYKCQYCPKEFTLQSSLRSHRLIHLDIRPFLCAECGKRFNHPSTLRRHTHILHRELCAPCEGGQGRSTGKTRRRAKRPIEELTLSIKDEVTYADVGVQSMPVVSIPIHIPHITVNIEQGFPQAYIIPSVTIPTTAQVIKPDAS